ncbi:hypothetical protein EDD90_2836 [Streptomyces sp. Ag109_O5-1]|uniref:hypothetical protein n=1 Tax=Streptomyces sp. Ag109_O5-1 TaxID=1938851 RepID=UPI000F4EE6CC|nr:hypothetical protein [Streptomyces sp. Ag109_O5-1]RPE39818.1 hypothetical protein EDD90_2836 [Streptomyces sp. Ag109_O5-1]
MPGTPDDVIAKHLRTMADGIDRDGLWTDDLTFADAASQALDVPASAYRTVTGRLPFLFAFPTVEASARACSLLQENAEVMDVLRAIAEHMAATWPDLDWTDDVIDRLANWPNLLGVTAELITQTLRDLAHSLSAAASAPAAA